MILFIDGHKSHITLQLSVKCQEIGIILYLLLPNTTHFLQPADVGAYKSLKLNWKKTVHEFHHLNPSLPLKRRDVAPLMASVLDKLTPNIIQNGFRKCGLYPLNVEAVDFSKILDVNLLEEGSTEDQPAAAPSSIQIEPKRFSSSEYKLAVEILENEIGHEIVAANQHERVSMPSVLYNIYKSLQVKACSSPRNEQPVFINLDKDSMVTIDHEVTITHMANISGDTLPCDEDPLELTSLDDPPTPPYNPNTNSPTPEDDPPTPPYKPNANSPTPEDQGNSVNMNMQQSVTINLDNNFNIVTNENIANTLPFISEEDRSDSIKILEINELPDISNSDAPDTLLNDLDKSPPPPNEPVTRQDNLAAEQKNTINQPSTSTGGEKGNRLSYHSYASKEYIFKSPKVSIKKRKIDQNKSYNVTSQKFRKSIINKDKGKEKK